MGNGVDLKIDSCIIARWDWNSIFTFWLLLPQLFKKVTSPVKMAHFPAARVVSQLRCYVGLLGVAQRSLSSQACRGNTWMFSSNTMAGAFLLGTSVGTGALFTAKTLYERKCVRPIHLVENVHAADVVRCLTFMKWNLSIVDPRAWQTSYRKIPWIKSTSPQRCSPFRRPIPPHPHPHR